MTKRSKNSLQILGFMLLGFGIIELIRIGNTDKFWIQTSSGILLLALYAVTEEIIDAIKNRK